MSKSFTETYTDESEAVINNLGSDSEFYIQSITTVGVKPMPKGAISGTLSIEISGMPEIKEN